jgi:hypothetical protein
LRPIKTKVGPYLLKMYMLLIHIFKKIDHLRITCDLLNFYFAFDEYTDVANKTEASKIANDVMDAFRCRDAVVPSSQGKIITMAQE